MLTHVQLEAGNAASPRVVTAAAAVTLGAALTTLKGFRKERTATNTALYADLSLWSPVGGGSTVTQDALAPDGTLTAYTLTDNDTTAFRGRILSRPVANDALAHVTSVYVLKDADASRLVGVAAQLNGGTPITRQVFLNTVTGALTDDPGYGAPAGSLAFVISEAKHWRVCIVLTNNTSGNNNWDTFLYPAVALNVGGSDASRVGSAVFCWPQLEDGAYPTSYIPTVNANVTRPEDQLVYPGSVISDTAGSAYVEFESTAGAVQGILSDAGAGSDRSPIYTDASLRVNAWDGTNTANANSAGGRVRGASVWGAAAMQTFAAGVPGSVIAYDGAFSLTSLGIGFTGLGISAFTGVIAGIEIYDKKFSAAAIAQLPSTGTYAVVDSLADPNYAYSANPTLVLAHFINEPGIGPEEMPIWSTVAACADINDQICGAGAQQEFRRRIGIYLDQQQEVGQIEDLLRAHAGCWTVREGGLVRFIADAPDSSVFHFTKGTYRLDSLVLTMRGRENSPTVVTVRWTNTAVEPWIEQETDPLKAAGVDGGSTPWIESSVPLPGIQQPGQAYREQVRRLNEFLLSDMTVKFVALDQGAKVLKGSVFELSDGEGLTQKAFRCTDVVPAELGRWAITGMEYDAAVHSDSPASAPSLTNTSLPDPSKIDAPTAMVITERVYLEKVLSADSLARGLIYQTRGEVSVTPPVHLFPFVYDWETWDTSVSPNVKIDDVPGSAAATYATPAVQQGKTYTVKVTARNGIGARSAVLSGTFNAQGKLLPPGDVPAITRAQELGGNVILEWTPAIDVDVTRYEWRYTPNVTGGGSWAGATMIDRVDGLRAWFPGLPVGTHRFYVKAIDSVGNYSTNAATTDITITSDADAFLQDHEFTSPTLTNMVSVPMVEGVWKPRWWTNVAADAFNTKITNPVNSTPNALIDAHTSATSKFQGEAWDLGSLVTGDWSLTPNTTNITGVATYAIETSPDGSAWTTQAGVTYSGSARYVRPVIQTLTTGTIAITAPPKISLAAVTQKESGTATSIATVGTPTTISLSLKYVKAVSLVITPKGTTSKTATYDNVILSPSGANSFDVYIFNAAGTQLAADFIWAFEGF